LFQTPNNPKLDKGKPIKESSKPQAAPTCGTLAKKGERKKEKNSQRVGQTLSYDRGKPRELGQQESWGGVMGWDRVVGGEMDEE